MIKILDNTKDLSVLATDQSNGLGKFQPKEAFVTQELNGIFEAEIKVPTTENHFNDIQVNSILKINSGEVIGEQMFRVYYISKPINNLVTIKCQHISYDLNKVAVKPFTSTGAVDTKNSLISNMIGTYPFTMTTDIENVTTVFALEIPKSFRECLGGWRGSVLDKFRCEYEWDNLNVGMKAHLGSDNGVRISYGKNLTDLTQEENIENVFTSVLGYAVVNEDTYVGNVYHKIQSTYPKIKIVDFSEDYRYDGDTQTVPTVEELTQKAQDYATRNDIEIPNVNLQIKFVPLYQTEEYKNIAPLERVGLGDTVHVFFDKLNVEATSRVVKTVWDVNLNKYDSVELGNAKANLSSVINDSIQQAKEDIENDLDIDTGFLETQMDTMSSLIINGLGLHKTVVPLATGGFRYYLHNKPTLAESDTQYVITSQGFMISQDYGQTWNSGWDASGNAVMNSLATITLKALEIVGSQITFGDPDSLYIVAKPYSVNGVARGITFDGSGYIRMQPQEQYIVNNLDADGNYYNRFLMSKSGNVNQPYIELMNYDKENHLLANFIELDSRFYLSTDTSDIYNRIVMVNYATLSGTRYSANSFQMEAHEVRNRTRINNYQLNSSTASNYLSMSATGTSTNFVLNNYKAGHSSLANQVYMEGAPIAAGGTNRVYIYNYDVDGSNIANTFEMSKTSNRNDVALTVYRGGTSLGGIILTRDSTGAFSIGAYIKGQTVSGTQYKECRIQLNSGNGDVRITGTGLYFNGKQIA